MQPPLPAGLDGSSQKSANSRHSTNHNTGQVNPEQSEFPLTGINTTRPLQE